MKKIIILFLVLTFIPLASNASERSLKKTMKKLTKKHSANLYVSDEIAKNNWAELKVGFKHSYKAKKIGGTDVLEYELVKIDGDKYFFDYSIDGKKKDYQKVYINGLEYTYRNGQIEDQYSFNKCIRFKEGKCTFEKLKRKKNIDTSLKNGVWERTWIDSGLATKATRKTIYDKYGLVIFEWTKYENKLQDYKYFISIKRVD